jgi:hypothetical protein
MAKPRTFELEELVLRPGTYFNPRTEVLVVVDDSPELDPEAVEADEGAEWVLVSDEVPVDEAARDALLEAFQARHHPRAAAAGGASADEEDEGLGDEDEEDELE